MWGIGTRVEHGSYFLDGEQCIKLNIKAVLIMTFCLLIIAEIMSTQYLASQFGYTQALGRYLFVYNSIPIYAPYKYWPWIIQLLQNYGMNNSQVVKYLSIGLSSHSFALLFPLLLMKIRQKALQKKSRQKTLHGSAHWASKEEIIRSGLLPAASQKQGGVYVGGWTDPKTKKLLYLRHNGPEHILAFAPTRSGKGVGLVIPTLLSWAESAFVFDIKGENFAYTAGWRKEVAKNNILRFDPTDNTGTGARYNPLTEIRLCTPHEYADIDNLCLTLADPQGTGGTSSDKYWIEASQSLLTGFVTHLLYKAKKEEFEPTLGDLYTMLTDPNHPINDTLRSMLNFEHDPENKQKFLDANGEITKTHPTVASKAREQLNRADKEASSVLSSATNAIKMFSDPILNKNVSQATFKLTDLMGAEKPTTLYVCVSPSNLLRFSSLLRILVTQIVTILADELKFEGGRSKSLYSRRLLLMLDEFPTLGSMPVFEKALAFIAGYGLKAYLITQDISQLQRVYTRDESIMSNAHIQIAYAPNKNETAEYISKMLGQETVIKRSQSRSVNKGIGTYSQSVQEQARPLLTPDEVMRLKGPLKNAPGEITEPGQMIIRAAGFAPVLGTQILYFKDPTFSARNKIAAPEKSDVITASQYKSKKPEKTEQQMEQDASQ